MYTMNHMEGKKQTKMMVPMISNDAKKRTEAALMRFIQAQVIKNIKISQFKKKRKCKDYKLQLKNTQKEPGNEEQRIEDMELLTQCFLRWSEWNQASAHNHDKQNLEIIKALSVKCGENEMELSAKDEKIAELQKKLSEINGVLCVKHNLCKIIRTENVEQKEIIKCQTIKIDTLHKVIVSKEQMIMANIMIAYFLLFVAGMLSDY